VLNDDAALLSGVDDVGGRGLTLARLKFPVCLMIAMTASAGFGFQIVQTAASAPQR
jgi:hypothetical protein